ncbi:hypothetical protein CC80DRAFT_430366 [Byssothecium circinans]|uniref:Fe2OG dioxygenase domain-containing protein n=1 Tax=Byssothecium circinans TaxID=147558 RepID=A0A6A5T9W9_9PLEO|nr:hypothetical protein CC80DRAFT_430366 [Byssothecium circinans]
MKRGPLDTFFKPPAPKKPKYEASLSKDAHPSYPFAIPHLPVPFTEQLNFAPAAEGQVMNGERDLDLVYYAPYIPAAIANGMFEFLRRELFFQRVRYGVKRAGGVETQVQTPRFTTVFGVDETARFDGEGVLVDAKTGKAVEKGRYVCNPRPIPQCLERLRVLTEGTTGEVFNTCLVNYYADGKDSIAFHSDDERFLGPEPAIASFSLGARRDFVLKHKPVTPAAAAGDVGEGPKQVKLALGSGDMVLMRGKTQSCWLHGVPKRAGDEAGKGRVNITFRRALVKGGTENYYRYNVGSGGVFRWSEGEGRMMAWEGEGGEIAVRREEV